MLFRTFFDEKLAQYAYMVGCQRTGEAILIDPPRHVDHIIEAAKKEGMTITSAAETHIHADFVSGARQLAVKHDAKLYLSDEGDENWKYQYVDDINAELVKDGDKFKVGNIEFEVMHTPGHTPESISFILTDIGGGASKPMGIFTGDFVFVGDIGRPDLLEKAAGMAGTADSGAQQMYDSVQRFKQLPDYMMVWPAHGAGSACGKSLGAVPSSTVGYEKQFNWAMKIDNKEEFIAELLKDQPEAPVYFAEMKRVNKVGPNVVSGDMPEWTDNAAEVEAWAKEDKHVLLDTRPASEFEKGFIPGAINIPFGKMLTNWAGWLVGYDEEMAVIVDKDQAEEALIALRSIHLDDVVKLVAAESVKGAATETYKTVDVEKFDQLKEDSQVIDVRNDTEWKQGHIQGAEHKMLGYLRKTGKELDQSKPVLIHCQSGARSAIAASVMKHLGFEDVTHLEGGFSAWSKKNSDSVVTPK
ncbi:hydroxyacylglutathione hydrolase [Bacillus ectoiniformans]|uniref:MBL fold metallo-hydrolase n=1 Tax=Bacillus ectoiniformans TaxID=1494429 RepID=UPI0019591CBC|nr:MBL fold metallo-hydrolase [Bacillus ectoiniformans]MBM7649900.1 hydroxyacylglutathione hydrolase [Bacillus ectoiniformans]